MEVIIDEKYGRFEYDKDLKAIFHRWKGFAFLEEVRHVAEVTNPIMAQHELVHVIADHTEMEMFGEDVSRYIAEEWIPAQEKIGVKNTFVVLSEEAFAQFSAQEMHEAAKHNSSIHIQHFSNLAEAIEAAQKYNQTHYAQT